MTPKPVFTNCVRPFGVTLQTVPQIFNPLMDAINLHCSHKRHDGYSEYIFVGDRHARLKKGTTLHLFVRDDGLIELTTARNLEVVKSLIAKPGDKKAFGVLVQGLERKLSALYPIKKATIAHYFSERKPAEIFYLVKTPAIAAAILPSQAHPRLIPCN